MTQGEVVKFAAGAAATMRADGCNVLVEGREQTLNHVYAPRAVPPRIPATLLPTPFMIAPVLHARTLARPLALP